MALSSKRYNHTPFAVYGSIQIHKNKTRTKKQKNEKINKSPFFVKNNKKGLKFLLFIHFRGILVLLLLCSLCSNACFVTIQISVYYHCAQYLLYFSPYSLFQCPSISVNINISVSTAYTNA